MAGKGSRLEEAWLRKSRGTRQPGHCLSHGLGSSPLPQACQPPSPHPRLVSSSQSCLPLSRAVQPQAPSPGIFGVRGPHQQGLMATVPTAGPGAYGAWERVPAAALLLCLHATFPVWRKRCRGEVPAGTSHHVTSFQSSLGRAGGNPEHRGENFPPTLFPSSAGQLLQHPPCSLVSAPCPAVHGSQPELAGGAGGGDTRIAVDRSSHEASKEPERAGSSHGVAGAHEAASALNCLSRLYHLISAPAMGRGMGLHVQHLLDMRGAQFVNHLPHRPQLSQPCLLPTQPSRERR